MKEIKRYNFINDVIYQDTEGDYIKHSDHLEAIAILEARYKELENAISEVIRISDRKHDAWDKVKQLLSTPTTADHLDALVEKRAGEMFEIKAYMAVDEISHEVMLELEKDDGIEWTPLYAKKANHD